MKCETADCTNDAKWKVYWPGVLIKLCTYCMFRTKGVSNTLGFVLEMEPLGPEDRA